MATTLSMASRLARFSAAFAPALALCAALPLLLRSMALIRADTPGGSGGSGGLAGGGLGVRFWGVFGGGGGGRGAAMPVKNSIKERGRFFFFTIFPPPLKVRKKDTFS